MTFNKHLVNIFHNFIPNKIINSTYKCYNSSIAIDEWQEKTDASTALILDAKEKYVDV